MLILKMESRGVAYKLQPRVWSSAAETTDDPRVLVWTVIGLPACTRCDSPSPVTVHRASGTDLRCEACGLQLGVLVQA
jgi:hypothetical protein